MFDRSSVVLYVKSIVFVVVLVVLSSGASIVTVGGVVSPVSHAYILPAVG